MTAVSRGPVPAFLLRTGIIAGVLAIIAGIFGMHVMTANHTMHSPAAQIAATSPGDGHTGHQSAAHHDVPDPTTHEALGKRVSVTLEAGPAAACTCSAECTSVQAMSAACIPSAKTGTLTAPEPGQGTLTSENRRGLLDRMSATYSYLPGSPSPGELSIRRT